MKKCRSCGGPLVSACQVATHTYNMSQSASFNARQIAEHLAEAVQALKAEICGRNWFIDRSIRCYAWSLKHENGGSGAVWTLTLGVRGWACETKGGDNSCHRPLLQLDLLGPGEKKSGSLQAPQLLWFRENRKPRYQWERQMAEQAGELKTEAFPSFEVLLGLVAGLPHLEPFAGLDPSCDK